MLAVIAAIIFAIAFIIRVTRTSTDAVFAPDSLLLAGLALLALHQAGIGAKWRFPPLTQPGRLKQVSGRGDRAPATRLW